MSSEGKLGNLGEPSIPIPPTITTQLKRIAEQAKQYPAMVFTTLAPRRGGDVLRTDVRPSGETARSSKTWCVLQIGLREIRVDRMERELQTESRRLEVFRPEHAVPEQFAVTVTQEVSLVVQERRLPYMDPTLIRLFQSKIAPFLPRR